MDNFSNRQLSCLDNIQNPQHEKFRRVIPCTRPVNTIQNEKFSTFHIPLKMKIKYFYVSKNFISIYDENTVTIYKYKVSDKVTLTKYRVIGNHLLLFTFALVSPKISLLLLNILNTLCERKIKKLREYFSNIILELSCRDIVDYEFTDNFLIITDKYGNILKYPLFDHVMKDSSENEDKIEKIKFKITDSQLSIHYLNRSFFEKVDFGQKVTNYHIFHNKVFVSAYKTLTIMVFNQN